MLVAPTDSFRLFSEYVKVTGIGRLEEDHGADPALQGKRLGLINGASWIALWCNYFGRLYLPGVKLVNAGNDAVQLNFTRAFAEGEPCPPLENIDSFARIARDLVDLADVDAILITCSTMNRSYPAVAEAVDVPVVQIDMPMMEAAISHGGEILAIATLTTTVTSTEALLAETAQRLGKTVDSTGVTVEEAWHRLAQGDIEGHNAMLAEAIREAQAREPIGCVLLAQISMAAFAFSFPDPVAEFGVPVFNSAETGFRRMGAVLSALDEA